MAKAKKHKAKALTKNKKSTRKNGPRLSTVGATSKSIKDSLMLSLDKKVWPVERDVLFRPDRLKYVRKLVSAEGCVFCDAERVGVGFESLVLHQTKLSMVVLNKFPYNPGHVLVIPRRHCGDILELTDAEYTDLQELVRKAFHALTRAFTPGGINLGLNHGAVAGAGIPGHLHYHLVPRWTGDLNFFPLIAETKAIPTSLEASYNSLLEAFR
jgi:ATP adenylyltransferase